MKCTLFLKGSYYDNNEIKYDNQNIEMFVDTNIQLSFNNKVIEDAWYSASVRIENFKMPFESVEFYVNDELIKTTNNLVLNNNNEIIEFEIKFLDENQRQLKTKQLFLLYYEIVKIKLVINYMGGKIELFSSEIPCVSKNIHNFKNVEQMIMDILDFNDDTITEWVYNVHSHKENENYGLLQGAFKKNTPKSLFSFIQLLKEIYNCYQKNIYLFKNQLKHIIIDRAKLIPYHQVKSMGHNEFVWLMHNADQLKETTRTSTIKYNGVSFLPNKIRAEKTIRNKDVYENRIVFSFLKLLYSRILTVKNGYGFYLKNERDIISKFTYLEHEGFYSPILQVKQVQITRGDKLLKELELLEESFSKLILVYQSIFECKVVRTNGIPRKTKTFQFVKHYKEIYNVILQWYIFGDFNLNKEELLLKIKKIDRIYEYYCLIKLLKMAKDRGYGLNQKNGGAFNYHYRLDNVFDVNNTYSLTDGVNELTIYYQPVLFSSFSNNSNNISLFRSDTDSYFTPDFLVKMYKEDKEYVHYAILDSKYSNRKNIRDFYLHKEIIKYVCSIAEIKSQTPAVRFLWLLQGRDYFGDQMEAFHKSVLSNITKPIPSYGIFTLNPSKNNLEKLWDEMMRCIS